VKEEDEENSVSNSDDVIEEEDEESSGSGSSKDLEDDLEQLNDFLDLEELGKLKTKAKKKRVNKQQSTAEIRL